jgi:hypothetical protein
MPDAAGFSFHWRKVIWWWGCREVESVTGAARPEGRRPCSPATIRVVGDPGKVKVTPLPESRLLEFEIRGHAGAATGQCLAGQVLEAHSMDDEVLFREYCQAEALGRRLDTRGLRPSAALNYDGLLRRIRAMVSSAIPLCGSLGNVYVDFVDNSCFNARAARYRDRYFIAMFSALPTVLITVTQRMLADPALFQHVGDPARERSGLPLFTRIRLDAEWMESETCYGTYPLCPVRKSYADHLCMRAIDFLGAHEMAHIANGHLDYLSKERNARSFMDEHQGMPGSSEGSVDLQALEMDADFSASFPFVTTMMRASENWENELGETGRFYKDSASVIYDLSVITGLLFRMFGDDRVSKVDHSNKSHPPNRWRQRVLCYAMCHTIETRWSPTLYPVAEKQFSRGLEDVEFAFDTVTGRERFVPGMHDAWGAAGIGMRTC